MISVGLGVAIRIQAKKLRFEELGSTNAILIMDVSCDLYDCTV